MDTATWTGLGFVAGVGLSFLLGCLLGENLGAKRARRRGQDAIDARLDEKIRRMFDGVPGLRIDFGYDPRWRTTSWFVRYTKEIGHVAGLTISWTGRRKRIQVVRKGQPWKRFPTWDARGALREMRRGPSQYLREFAVALTKTA